MFLCKSYICITFFFLFIFIISPSISECQTNEKVKKLPDTTYIKDLSDLLAVRFLGISKFNKFKISDQEIPFELQYAPNSNLNFGFGVNYKWFGLGIAFNIPFINNDDEKYGKTRRIDAQTNIFARKFLIDVYLHKYQGFYVENPESYLPEWDASQPYPQRPDIYTASFSGSFIYVFNHTKYSAKAAFVQTDLQRKSAGSFLLGGFFSLNGVAGDSSFIPYELKDIYNPELQFREVGTAGLGVAFGYSHTFVMWKKFYLSFTFVPGFSAQSYEVKYEDADEDRTGSLIAGRFLARGAFVYNTEKSFAGFTASNDSFSGNTGKENKNTINFDVGMVRFFYGRRFNIKKKSHP